MAGHLDAHELEITCPECGRKFKKSIGWIKANKQFACDCGRSFDADQFAGEFAKVDRAIEDFKRKLKNFGK